MRDAEGTEGSAGVRGRDGEWKLVVRLGVSLSVALYWARSRKLQ